MVRITNTYQRAVTLLASQFRNTLGDGTPTNFQRLLRAISSSFQDVENVLWQMKTERWLATSFGIQLDNLGEILGLDRSLDETDQEYRDRLQFQVFINSSKGTPEEVMSVLKFVTKAPRVFYWDIYPACFALATTGRVMPVPPLSIVSGIQKVSPAGVRASVICWTDGEVPLQFATDPVFEPIGVIPEDELQTLEVNTTELLYINRGKTLNPGFGGWFAEYGSPEFDTEGAGQLAEGLS